MKNPIILEIAKKVRKAVEEMTHDTYLDEMCAITSAFFVKKLSENGIFAKLAVGTYDSMGHAWVEYNEHIIDLTVTQFDSSLPKIYSVLTKHKLYSKMETIEDLSDKEKLQTVFEEWPGYQRPEEIVLKRLEKFYQNIA